jgi:ribosomal protein S19
MNLICNISVAEVLNKVACKTWLKELTKINPVFTDTQMNLHDGKRWIQNN